MQVTTTRYPDHTLDIEF